MTKPILMRLLVAAVDCLRRSRGCVLNPACEEIARRRRRAAAWACDPRASRFGQRPGLRHHRSPRRHRRRGRFGTYFNRLRRRHRPRLQPRILSAGRGAADAVHAQRFARWRWRWWRWRCRRWWSGGGGGGGGGGAIVQGPPLRASCNLPPAGETRFENDASFSTFPPTCPAQVLDAHRRAPRHDAAGNHDFIRLTGRTLHVWRIDNGTPVAQMIRNVCTTEPAGRGRPAQLPLQRSTQDQQEPVNSAQYAPEKLKLHRCASPRERQQGSRRGDRFRGRCKPPRPRRRHHREFRCLRR